jgi:acyl carrier protein
MNMQEIMDIQTAIIHEVFENSDLVITPLTTADDVDEWDSLTHLQLISAIEQKFKVRFALGELQSLKNVGDMADLIQKKLGALK